MYIHIFSSNHSNTTSLLYLSSVISVYPTTSFRSVSIAFLYSFDCDASLFGEFFINRMQTKFTITVHHSSRLIKNTQEKTETDNQIYIEILLSNIHRNTIIFQCALCKTPIDRYILFVRVLKIR